MKREEVKLGELFSIKHGFAFKSVFFDEGGRFIVTTPGHFYEKGGFRLRDGKEKYYIGPFSEEYILKKGDLIIAMTEQGEGLLGSTAIIPEDEKYLHNQRLGLITKIKNERVHWKYIYYLMNTYEIRGLISASSTGTKVKHTSPKKILDLTVDLPPLKTQKKIAFILSAYDDLVENNLKRIKLLEEAAQNIYKEWFVHFRFPGYEAADFTEEGLPVGWKKEIVGNVLEKIKRKLKIKKEQYLEKGTIPIIDQGADFIGGFTNDEEFKQDIPLPIIVFGDHTRRVKFIDFPFASGADGTQLMYPNIPELLPTYFYFSISSIDLSNYAYARHFKFIKEEKILIPKKNVLEKFNHLTYPFLKQTNALRDINSKLQEARDLLLPRLMDRTIEV